MFDLVDLVDGALDLATSGVSFRAMGWLLLNVFFGVAVYFLCVAIFESSAVSAALQGTPLVSLNREYVALGSAAASLIPFNFALWRFSRRWS